MVKEDKKVQILDCTLRDGSYAIDFQFTPEDTAIIAVALEKAGINFIEIGHGLGLNASNMGEGRAAATDDEYLKTAASVLKRAKFGMFFIPGIGKERNLRIAADLGMGFVRIGTNAPEANKAGKYIKLAKKLGFFVCSNLMKSYALSPDALAEKAKVVEEEGADVVYIVDSAGGMLPKDIKEYIEAIKTKVDSIKIGIHAHNNLSLAVANTLVAVESGATMLDCCLQGIGRSAGNTPTEILILALEKLGYDLGIDVLKLMDLGEKLINPLIHKAGFDPIEITSGYALFHSKFLYNIYKVAEKYGVDPRRLIIEASKKSVVELPERLIVNVAKKMKSKKTENKIIAPISRIDLKEIEIFRNSKEKIKDLALELFAFSKKRGKKSIFVISTSRNGQDVISPFIREDRTGVIVNCEVSNLRLLDKLLNSIDGIVDIILVDAEKKISNISLADKILKTVKKSEVILYQENDLWARAVDILISQLMKNRCNLRIVIFGCNIPSVKLAIRLLEKDAKVIIWDKNPEILEKIVKAIKTIHPHLCINKKYNRIKACLGADVLVGFTIGEVSITKEVLKNLSVDVLVVDAGVGTISLEGIKYAIKKGLKIYRVDMRSALSGDILSILETKKLLRETAGRSKLNGVSIIAGGIIGKKGEVVVDSIFKPTKILGIADGRGNLVKDMNELKKYSRSIERVRYGIIQRIIK